MHSPPPAEEQAQLLILLAHLPELERELVLWVLHLLHELALPSERVTSHSQGSQQMILSSAFRTLAPHLLLRRAGAESPMVVAFQVRAQFVALLQMMKHRLTTLVSFLATMLVAFWNGC